MKTIIKIKYLTRILSYASFILIAISCHQQDKETVTIAAAANMQVAITEISKVFTEQTGIPCALVISSSGKLTAQIKEGAPYDVFISANMKYPNEVYTSGLAIHAPKIYAYGQLVLWSLDSKIQPSMAMLTDESIQHIAIANPKTAPYGEAAIQVLKSTGTYDRIENKLVYGENIGQTNQFIMSGSVAIGFTAKSVVLSPKMKGKGHWISLDKDMYQSINQGIVIVKRKDAPVKNAQLFYDFLFSSEAKEILEDFGYLLVQ